MRALSGRRSGPRSDAAVAAAAPSPGLEDEYLSVVRIFSLNFFHLRSAWLALMSWHAHALGGAGNGGSRGFAVVQPVDRPGFPGRPDFDGIPEQDEREGEAFFDGGNRQAETLSDLRRRNLLEPAKPGDPAGDQRQITDPA